MAADVIRADRKYVLEAMKENVEALNHAAVALLADRKFVLEIMLHRSW